MIDLKQFRKKNKITQLELAEYLGVTNGFISFIENGRSVLSDDKLEKLRNNDRGWTVDELEENAKPLSETERLNEETERLNEMVNELMKTIKSQQETIRTQSETINMLVSSKEERGIENASSARSAGTHSRL